MAGEKSPVDSMKAASGSPGLGRGGLPHRAKARELLGSALFTVSDGTERGKLARRHSGTPPFGVR